MTLTTTGRPRLKYYQHTAFKAVGETTEIDGTTEQLAEGEFIALASVFGNIDSYGERLVKGAFAETLEEWKASGNPIPVIWQHDWSDPDSHIGEVLWARETDEGLLYKGRLDIEDNAKAARVYKLMKGRRVTQQSFGFDVIDGAAIVEDEKSVFEITKVKLYEVGPCLVGVNQATDVLDIKSGNPAAPAADERSGQGDPSASGAASEPSGSSPSPAAKGLSPASVLLIIESETIVS